jgi:nucleoside-diphosphate-sugar epimerase
VSRPAGRALVTGAGGFVGRAVSAALLDARWEVVALVRKRRPEPRAGLTAVAADLESGTLPGGAYDCVVHCAAEVPAYCPDPDLLYRNNVEGTARLLALEASRFIYMSSMAACGPIKAPEADERSPLAAGDPYGRSKAEGERLVEQWSRSRDRAAVSIRLPGVVGAGGRNNFLCDSLQRILRDQPVSARNPDAPFNNVVHVRDLAAFVCALAGRLPAGHAALTVAAREPLAIREVLERMHRRAARAPRIEWQPPGGNPFLIRFERAVALGYRPATVADSVERFVDDSLAAA